MSKPTGKQVTLNDVARASGVSYQTVSRVVNDSPHVARSTRDRVLAAIATLGYRPNRAARQLVTGRSKTIGIISFGTNHYGPAQTVASIERALLAQGYGFALASIEDLSIEQIGRAVTELDRHQVDGLVMVTPLLGADLQRIRTLCAGRAYVMIDICQGAEVPSVLIDQEAGAAMATRHLLELGHRRICEISGPLTWCDAFSRHRAWERTLREAGVAPGASVEGDWSARSGYDAAGCLVDEGEPFSALVVGNDQMALGAIHALVERGLAVPDRVSVVGFDDIPEAAYFLPALTTVRQDFQTLGRRAADVILELIEKPAALPGDHLLLPQLVQRRSTAAPHVGRGGG